VDARYSSGPVKFLVQVVDYAVSRYLARRGRQHLAEGAPVVAMFAFDHIGQEIGVGGRYAAADLECAFRFLAERGAILGVAVDVGANIGNHALFFAPRYEQVYALEPNPRVFELLEINARLVSNVVPIRLGASDRPGVLPLAYSPANWGAGNLGPAAGDGSRTVQVEVKALDGMAELASLRIGLVKIDVEGHELQVLSGAVELLKRSRPVILFEQQPADISAGSSKVVDWLRTQGYQDFFEVRAYPALPRGWQFPGRMAINALLRLAAGERKRVVPIARFESAFYPMIIALHGD
jgi:FkbM family methyltransferase